MKKRNNYEFISRQRKVPQLTLGVRIPETVHKATHAGACHASSRAHQCLRVICGLKTILKESRQLRIKVVKNKRKEN